MSKNSEKKVIVITGATSGIGRASVLAFSKDNIVFAGYRNPKYEQELLEIPNVIPFYIDMEKPYTITGAVDFIKSKTGRVDILINAAGCVIAGPVENMEISRIRKQFEVNTFAHLDFTQNLILLFEDSRVVNISSMSSFGIFPFVAPYCASKRAMDILFNSLELEMGCSGKRVPFRVISIKPGVIATPLWEKSVNLNRDALQCDKKYEKEMLYMVENAQRNGQKGLAVENVVKLLKKVCEIKNPKSSYTIGRDAFIAEIVSKLSPTLINTLIKLGMKKKFG